VGIEEGRSLEKHPGPVFAPATPVGCQASPSGVALFFILWTRRPPVPAHYSPTFREVAFSEAQLIDLPQSTRLDLVDEQALELPPEMPPPERTYPEQR
jgi:hypothetical protein